MPFRKVREAKPYPAAVLEKSRPSPQWLTRSVPQGWQQSESTRFLSRTHIRHRSRVVRVRHGKFFFAPGLSP